MFKVDSNHLTQRNKATDHQSLNTFLDDVEQHSDDSFNQGNDMYKAIGETTYEVSREYQYQNN